MVGEGVEFPLFFDKMMDFFAYMATLIVSSTQEDGKLVKEKFVELVGCTLGNSVDKAGEVLVGLQQEANVELEEISSFENGAKLFTLIAFFL